MSRLKQFVISCCLLIVVQSGYPSEVKKHCQYHDWGPVIIIANIPSNGTDKSAFINASIENHYLTLVFTENLGQVSIEITTAADVPVEALAIATPNGQVFYIARTGDYTVTITLANGDEYYGEFTVTD